MVMKGGQPPNAHGSGNNSGGSDIEPILFLIMAICLIVFLYGLINGAL